jgi:hypothetical protein
VLRRHGTLSSFAQQRFELTERLLDDPIAQPYAAAETWSFTAIFTKSASEPAFIFLIT